MKVLIGTNNKGKVEGAKQAFEKFYENVWFNKRSIYNGTNWIYKWRCLERLENNNLRIFGIFLQLSELRKLEILDLDLEGQKQISK